MVLPDVTCLTVHGRSLETVNLHLRDDGHLLILSWDGTTPAKLAALLSAKGYGGSRLHVLEHMGGDDENYRDGIAADWSDARTADLNTIGVELVAGEGAAQWSRAAGLPEDAFRHDNMITKREVRAITLAALAPLPGELLWDVGAGSGTVAVEWLRLEPSARAIAMERNAERAANARHNALELGVPRLQVIEGEAPDLFGTLDDAPDAVFVGGGVSETLLAACWQQLKRDGRLISNAVTLEGQQALIVFKNSHGGSLTRISISRDGAIGPRTGLRPLLDVWQLRAEKN